MQRELEKNDIYYLEYLDKKDWGVFISVRTHTLHVTRQVAP